MQFLLLENPFMGNQINHLRVIKINQSQTLTIIHNPHQNNVPMGSQSNQSNMVCYNNYKWGHHIKK